MNQKYADDPSRAPWVYGVCMYVRHIEFLTNKYNGSNADQILEAKDLLQRITPETGTLDQVEAFYSILEQTFDDFYGRNSPIGKFLARDETEPDGRGSDYFRPIVYNTQYNAMHDSFVRSAFVVDERNEFLSLINDERTRYVDANIKYDQAVFNAKLPPKTKELDPAISGECKFTVPGCDNEFSAFAYPNAKKCSGKILSTPSPLASQPIYQCICPSGTVENDEGKCVEKIETPLLTFEIDTDQIWIEDKVDYEANKIKKRKDYNKKNKFDCQYVHADWNGNYHWKTPKGFDNKESKYDVSKHGYPSQFALEKRKIKCSGSALKPKKRKCYCSTKSNGVWSSEDRSLSKIKDKVRASIQSNKTRIERGRK
jgi:hypothetical protein